MPSVNGGDGGRAPKFLKEAVQFFKKNPGFHRLFTLFIEKYRSLGRIGGSVKLTNPTPQEREALSIVFRKDFTGKKSITVSLEKFIEALGKTKFAGIDFKELLDSYAGKEILSKEEEWKLYEKQKEAFFKKLLQKYPQNYCRLWLQNIIDKGPGSRGIHTSYDNSRNLLKKEMEDVLEALVALENSTSYKRLPVFASEITGNPHDFDLNSNRGRFFIWALQIIRQNQEKNYEFKSAPTAEELTEILHHFGILRDDLLNFVTCTGILAYEKDGIHPHSLWQSAWESGSVINVPLREIVKLDKFLPAGSKAETAAEAKIEIDQSQCRYLCQEKREDNTVFVVENSGVFSELLDALNPKKPPALICTHGQFKLSTLLLLDGLVANGTTVYYSGDFDPEGLQMAQRLIKRYPGSVKLWHMRTEDYKRSLSKVYLDEQRLNKLASITVSELLPVKEMLKSTKRAGYQEFLIADLEKDIR